MQVQAGVVGLAEGSKPGKQPRLCGGRSTTEIASSRRACFCFALRLSELARGIPDSKRVHLFTMWLLGRQGEGARPHCGAQSGPGRGRPGSRSFSSHYSLHLLPLFRALSSFHRTHWLRWILGEPVFQSNSALTVAYATADPRTFLASRELFANPPSPPLRP